MNRIKTAGRGSLVLDEDQCGRHGSRDGQPGQTGIRGLTGLESTSRWLPARRDGSKARKRPAVTFSGAPAAPKALGAFP
jgi:hypothetical protein